MGLYNNDDVPGAIVGVLSDENHYKSRMVKETQQGMLDKSKRREPQTSRSTVPNIDEKLCGKKCLKIGNINPKVFIRACNLLNIEHVMGQDWRMLAGQLDYNVTDVQIFGCKENHAETMLKDWDSNQHNYLERVVKELRDMRRADVADLLQKEIDKKGDSCNCPDCGHV
ncbi:Tumor necrosis factor receptor superfamily member 16 [Paramuricea clavata]|uniref:Tumor necrosis factor receptor superfamily member 16, partial n=2 Tax=Paramuricea clavata TaxID=317549 RepID=A0A7D9EWL6_PARCT|nr:Tumor necrosis factor receptor superfamily member 16 [Paramuricea clavata]